MALHDAYLRITPYELAIPGRAFADERFAFVQTEAQEREVDPGDPGQFPLLGEVGRLLQELATAEGSAEDRIRHLGAILYQGFHFWAAQEPIWLVTTPVARYLVESGVELDEGAPVPIPSASGYVQLPRNLFWARVDDEGTPEALDGIFWTAAGETVQLLGVLGVRGDRPGMSVVELSGVPLAALGEAVRETIREDGADFATDLPGGELENLYSIQTGGELLKLLASALLFIDRHPEAAFPLVSPDAESLDSGAPRPSALPGSLLALSAPA